MATASSQTIPTHTTPPIRWFSRFVHSTVGGKYIVAVTGLALTGFVLFHMLGNLQIFLGRDAFNSYAHSVKSTPALLWLARGGLLTFLVIHLFVSLRLQKRSLDARPVPYVYERSKKASVSSRYMALTGITILLFIAFHLAHLTLGFSWIATVEDKNLGERTNYLNLVDVEHQKKTGEVRHDAYRMFIDGFRTVPISVLYIVCQGFLGMHLVHGVRSAFQSLGINGAKINSGLNLLGDGLTYVVVGGNIIMPLAVMARVIGADVP